MMNGSTPNSTSSANEVIISASYNKMSLSIPSGRCCQQPPPHAESAQRKSQTLHRVALVASSMFVYLLPLLPSPGGYPDVPLLLLQPGLIFALCQPGGVSLPHGRWAEPGELNPGGLESLHVGGAPLGWPPPPPFLPWAIAAPVAKNNAAIKTATIAAINIFPTRYLPRSPQDVKT